jgi:hypothetical protein
MIGRITALLIAAALVVAAVPGVSAHDGEWEVPEPPPLANLSVSAHGEQGVFPGFPPFYEARESLSFVNQNITDERLAQMVADGSIPRGIEQLALGVNQITDLAPLAELTELVALHLHDNRVSDISPLAGLTNLRYLCLTGLTYIEDISPLSGLTELRALGLGGNQISDLTPLSGLINLQSVTISVNPISDFSPLNGLTNLLNLCLNGSQITDISSLAGLTSLRALDLGHNMISDFSPLESLTNLEWLRYAPQLIAPPESENPQTGIFFTATPLILAAGAAYFSRRKTDT